MKIEFGQQTLFSHTITFAGSSDRGCIRPHNEDSFLLLPQNNIFCLADGVGGLDAGEVASRKAVDCIQHQIVHTHKKRSPFLVKILSLSFPSTRKKRNILDKAICHANKEIYDLANIEKNKMATKLDA